MDAHTYSSPFEMFRIYKRGFTAQHLFLKGVVLTSNKLASTEGNVGVRFIFYERNVSTIIVLWHIL